MESANWLADCTMGTTVVSKSDWRITNVLEKPTVHQHKAPNIIYSGLGVHSLRYLLQEVWGPVADKA